VTDARACFEAHPPIVTAAENALARMDDLTDALATPCDGIDELTDAEVEEYIEALDMIAAVREQLSRIARTRIEPA
jgi:hypothetical protein